MCTYIGILATILVVMLQRDGSGSKFLLVGYLNKGSVHLRELQYENARGSVHWWHNF